MNIQNNVGGIQIAEFISQPQDLHKKENDQLIADLLKLRQQEKSLTLESLHHLIEIEKRGLELQNGYSSIYAYCEEVLNYSSDEAYLRINAMKLMINHPILETHLKSGAMSLTNISKAHSVFKRENKRRKLLNEDPLALEETAEVLETLKNKSTRAFKEKLAESFPEVHESFERSEPVAHDRVEITFSITKEDYKLIEKLKDYKSHVHPDRSHEALFMALVKKELQKMEKQWGVNQEAKPETNKSAKSKKSCSEKMTAAKEKKSAQVHTQENQTQPSKQNPAQPPPGAHRKIPNLRKPISARIKKQLFAKAQHQCQYTDHKSGRKCCSTHNLQIDHIQPIALGGSDKPENLQILCAKHNQLRARNTFSNSSACVVDFELDQKT